MKDLTRISLLALAFSLATTTPLFADTIVPGQTLSPVPTAGYGVFTQLDSTGLQPYSFGGNNTPPNKDQGTVEQLVGTSTNNPFGVNDITFLYQFKVTKGDISGFSVSDFTGFQTNVFDFAGHLPDFSGGTLIAPSSVSRSGGLGTNVQVNFQPNAFPGDTSYVLIVYTNATAYDDSTIGLQDSGGQTLNGFEPVPPSVPEPSSLLLLGTGLLGVGATVRRRFSI